MDCRLRLALVFFSLAFVVAFAADACPETLVVAGYGVTRGMGERPGAEAALAAAGRFYAVETSWFAADKIESGAGWGARAAAEARWRGLGAGLSYTYRDGGGWVKRYAWARVSASRGPVRVIGDWALGGFNRERRLELRLTGAWKHAVIQPRLFVVQHCAGWGFGSALLFGIG